MGGINGIDISNWIISDDTLYSIGVTKGMLTYKGSIDEQFIMNVKIVRRLDQFGGDGMCELLLQVDDEYMDMYREETGEQDFNQESFNQWITEKMENSQEGEEWKCKKVSRAKWKSGECKDKMEKVVDSHGSTEWMCFLMRETVLFA